MNTRLIGLAVAALALATTSAAIAQQPKSGGILRMYHRDSPPSMSIHEEATDLGHVIRSWRSSTTSSCTTSTRRRTASTRSCPTWPTSWAWSEDGKTLTFKLRQGVKWHDGKPFTAADVKCTFDMLLGQGAGTASARTRARTGTATSRR